MSLVGRLRFAAPLTTVLALQLWACARQTPLPAPPPDPTLEWNAALAAVQHRGLTPAQADPATGRIETRWSDAGNGTRERFIIVLEGDHAHVTREVDPPGPSAEDPTLANEITAIVRARR